MIPEVRLVIADDHPIFRQGLKQVIQAAPGLAIVAEAGTGEEALRLTLEHKPDVVLLDVDMPVMDGFETARAIYERNLPVKLVFLTLYRDEMHFNEALDLGVAGYLIKDSAAAEVVRCIQTVSQGQNYISPTLSTFLLNSRRSKSAFPPLTPTLSSLTAAERRVLFHLAEYKTNKEIAATAGLSVRTVEKHRANICDKLNLHGSHALVKFAAKHKNQL